VLSEIVDVKLTEIMKTKGRAPAMRFAQALPPSMVKVFALDRARHGKAVDSTELEDDSTPSGPSM
jgi:hypothetical protein